MADEAPTPTPTPDAPPAGEPDAAAKPDEEDQRVPYERFQKANQKAKEAAAAQKAAEDRAVELQRQMEERESAGLPELDRMKKDLERAQKRAEEAEQRAAEQEKAVQRSARERWVIAAAKDFVDADDAVKNVNLDDLEDPRDAERAVKAVAKAKPHLLKTEDPQIPGRVLANGRTPTADKTPAVGSIDAAAEAESLAGALKQFTDRWHTAGE